MCKCSKQFYLGFGSMYILINTVMGTIFYFLIVLFFSFVEFNFLTSSAIRKGLAFYFNGNLIAFRIQMLSIVMLVQRKRLMKRPKMVGLFKDFHTSK